MLSTQYFFHTTKSRKLDKHIIKLYKNFCGMPNSTLNIITHLRHEMFGIEAFSLINAYPQYIEEQLSDALNDSSILETIYQGLIDFIIAKHNGV